MQDLKDFLDQSPTPFHAAELISSALDNSGYERLDERNPWNLEAGKGYYLKRDDRSVTAFIPGRLAPAESGFRIAAAHLDSPLLKLKTEAGAADKGSWRYPVEIYGSTINGTWIDRGLEAAGYLSWKDASGTVNFQAWRSGEAIAVIPSLAIHYNRDVNKGVELNSQKHMAALIPIYSDTSNDIDPLTDFICRDLKIKSSDLVSSELYLVPDEKASFLGHGDNQLIMSGRLDNLAMAHAILKSLPLNTEARDTGIIASWFDAEEVGSKTPAGASSLYLDEIIERLVISSSGGREELMRARRSSFLVSTDMAHAVHPNYSDFHDPSYAPLMGGGPVIKSHSQKHYATDVHSETRLMSAAEIAGIQMQKLIFRSDLACGYSLGPLASSSASINAVDIGNPLWGMHSARETASMSDHMNMIKLLVECWNI